MSKIIHFEYWRKFAPPNHYNFYLDDYTCIRLDHDGSELCNKVIGIIRSYEQGSKNIEMYDSLYECIKDLPKHKCDSYIIDEIKRLNSGN